MTMQEGIPPADLEEWRGSLKGRNPSGGDYWSRGSGEFDPGYRADGQSMGPWPMSASNGSLFVDI